MREELEDSCSQGGRPCPKTGFRSQRYPLLPRSPSRIASVFEKVNGARGSNEYSIPRSKEKKKRRILVPYLYPHPESRHLLVALNLLHMTSLLAIGWMCRSQFKTLSSTARPGFEALSSRSSRWLRGRPRPRSFTTTETSTGTTLTDALELLHTGSYPEMPRWCRRSSPLAKLEQNLDGPFFVSQTPICIGYSETTKSFILLGNSSPLQNSMLSGAEPWRGGNNIEFLKTGRLSEKMKEREHFFVIQSGN